MSKNYLPLFSFLFLAFIANAQKSGSAPRHQKWELGLQAGVIQSQNDMNDFGPDENNFGGGLLLRYHLDDLVALRGNLLYGEISGNDQNNPDRSERGFRFSAPVTEGSLLVELDLLGKRRWKQDGKFRRTVSPYLFGGAGYTLSTPSVYYNEAGNEALRDRIAEDKSNIKEGHIVMPLGLGLKVDLSENWTIGLETGIRVLFDDYIDGVSAAGNSRKNDTYSLSGLNVAYRFNYTSDKDHDGVPDREDACPDAKGTRTTGGCPDTDADGVADKNDLCPDMKGLASTGGCPDTDGDGISDKSDLCPDAKGTVANGGCPDKDKDGIIDLKDNCPDEFGAAKFGGCPDADNDGVKDAEDKCPQAAGPVSNQGCPINDRDRDGVLDEQDKCPDAAGTEAMMGCPDTDKDGVANHIDKCPEVAGLPSAFGCPALAEADKKVLEAALYGVQFEAAKSVIKSGSFAILDQVAEVMGRYPAYQLTISGHTDSDGSEASNLRLSDARAKACYDYLLSKNILAERMKYAGYGETQPVADNKTKEGKSKNRRVEFGLAIQ